MHKNLIYSNTTHNISVLGHHSGDPGRNPDVVPRCVCVCSVCSVRSVCVCVSVCVVCVCKPSNPLVSLISLVSLIPLLGY